MYSISRPAHPFGGYMIDYREHSDVQLVEAFLRGEERAFNELHRRYEEKLIVFVYNYVFDHDKAKDLVQETFFRVGKHLKRFDQTKGFSTWVHTIALNLAKNEARNHKRNPVIYFGILPIDDEIGEVEFEDFHSLPDVLVEMVETKEFVWSVIDELPPIFRKVFILRDIEGYAYEAISQKLGVSLGTVKSRVFRGREAFRKIILHRAHLIKGSF